MIEKIVKNFKEVKELGYGLELNKNEYKEAYSISLKDLNKQLKPYGLIAGLDPHNKDKQYIVDTLESMDELKQITKIVTE